MSTVDDLKAAKAVIEERGWLQGSLTDGHRVCAVEALNLACYGTLISWNAAMDALIAHLPEGFSWVPIFNDDPATTKQDVLDLFDKALAELGGLA